MGGSSRSRGSSRGSGPSSGRGKYIGDVAKDISSGLAVNGITSLIDSAAGSDDNDYPDYGNDYSALNGNDYGLFSSLIKEALKLAGNNDDTSDDNYSEDDYSRGNDNDDVATDFAKD